MCYYCLGSVSVDVMVVDGRQRGVSVALPIFQKPRREHCLAWVGEGGRGGGYHIDRRGRP